MEYAVIIEWILSKMQSELEKDGPGRFLGLSLSVHHTTRRAGTYRHAAARECCYHGCRGSLDHNSRTKEADKVKKEDRDISSRQKPLQVQVNLPACTDLPQSGTLRLSLESLSQSYHILMI